MNVLLDLDLQLFTRSLDNTGGRGGGGKKGTGKGKKGACLVDFNSATGCDAKRSQAVAHLAGSPTSFRSDDAAATRAGVVLVGNVRDQRDCSVCVNAVIASAAEAAVAAARRIDARTLDVDGSFAYHCVAFVGDPKPRRSCAVGWSFESALESMVKLPNAFFLNNSCVSAGGASDLTTLTNAALQGVCTSVYGSQCASTGITCSSDSFEGLWDVQRHLRR